MSECDTYCDLRAPRNAEFYGDHFGHSHMWVTRPRFVQYIVRVRRPWERRYEIVCRTDSKDHAFRELGAAMTDKKWFRGDVLGEEGPDSYYGPTVLVEMKR